MRVAYFLPGTFCAVLLFFFFVVVVFTVIILVSVDHPQFAYVAFVSFSPSVVCVVAGLEILCVTLLTTKTMVCAVKCRGL